MGQPSRFLSRRQSDLAKIHLGAEQLVGDDDEAYRDMLEAVTGKRSAAQLDELERREVLKHLAACGVKFKPPARTAPSDADDPGGPAARKAPRSRPRPALVQPIRTIDALCINHPGGRKPRGWAEAILKRMTKHSHRTPLEWATEGQLRDVEQAIRVDIARHRRRGGAA